MIRNVVLTVTAAFLAATGAVGQEVIDFGTVETIYEDTHKAGIGSIHVIREGSPRGPKTVWTAEVEAFDFDGELVADLEIRWPGEKTMEVTCKLAGTGASYHYVAHEGEPYPYFKFKDYATGKSVHFRKNGPPRKSTRKIIRNKEELKRIREEARRDSQDVTIEGSFTSLEEMQAEYGGILSIIGMVPYEVETIFGIAPGQQRKFRQPVSLKRPEINNKLFFCGPSEPFCNFDLYGLGEAEVYSGGKTRCCTLASQDADNTCTLHSTVPCCANSFCQVTSLICIDNYCRCDLLGYMFDCPYYECATTPEEAPIS